MTPEDYRRLEEVFHRALRLKAAERRAYLENECGSESDLRNRVEALLANAARESELLPGVRPERLGPFRILELLGEGGMGVVYLAEEETPIRRRVAIKLIKPGMDSREVLARFELERRSGRDDDGGRGKDLELRDR